MVSQSSRAFWRFASRLTRTFQGQAAHADRAPYLAEPQRLTGSLIEPAGISSHSIVQLLGARPSHYRAQGDFPFLTPHAVALRWRALRRKAPRTPRGGLHVFRPFHPIQVSRTLRSLGRVMLRISPAQAIEKDESPNTGALEGSRSAILQ